MKTMKNKITPMDVAKAIGVEEEYLKVLLEKEQKYLNVLLEQELNGTQIMIESEKAKFDFLNEDFVDFPK